MTYAFAKTGGVKFLADGDVPDDIETVTIKVKEKDEPDVEGEGQLAVKLSLDHFSVTISPDTVAHSDTTSVLILPKTINNETIFIPDTTLLDITLDNNGELYGTLLAGDGSMNKSLKGVSFSYLKDKQLKYIADGENPINCCPPLIYLNLILSRDTTINGMDSAWVKCKIDFERFSQGDSRWGDDDYDTYIDTVINNDTTYFKIRKKGCALTCLSMVLNTCGFTTDPGKLNKWKIDNNGYVGPDISWIIYPEEENMGYLFSLPSDSLLNLSNIDKYLHKCYILITKVINPLTEENHWVIINGKKDGKYNIVDPGSINGKTLDEYNNKIYKCVIYKKIN